jgi:nucleoside-triphosphatase THEP1
MPALCRDLANDTTPDLSDTLMRARRTTAVLAVDIVGKVCLLVDRIGESVRSILSKI